MTTIKIQQPTAGCRRKKKDMFEWKYDAVIYKKSDGCVLYSKMFDTYEEAQIAIVDNIKQFADKDYPPTGHINKDYVQVSLDKKKAIVFLDMPDSCYNCKFERLNGCDCKVCTLIQTDTGYPETGCPTGSKPDWCPIVELPEEKNNAHTQGYEDGWNEGWNAFRGTILGNRN